MKCASTSAAIARRRTAAPVFTAYVTAAVSGSRRRLSSGYSLKTESDGRLPLTIQQCNRLGLREFAAVPFTRTIAARSARIAAT